MGGERRADLSPYAAGVCSLPHLPGQHVRRSTSTRSQRERALALARPSPAAAAAASDARPARKQIALLVLPCKMPAQNPAAPAQTAHPLYSACFKILRQGRMSQLLLAPFQKSCTFFSSSARLTRRARPASSQPAGQQPAYQAARASAPDASYDEATTPCSGGVCWFRNHALFEPPSPPLQPQFLGFRR